MGYQKRVDGESAACHEYEYDALMRPVQRRDSGDRTTTIAVRDFTYNSPSELTEDSIENFIYFCYNIGNRKTAWELEEEIFYEINRLNQTPMCLKPAFPLNQPLMPTVTRLGSRLQRAFGISLTTPMTVPSPSPARIAGLSSHAAIIIGDGALRRK